VEIKIKRIETQDIRGDASDVINTYIVIEKGKEFRITCRTHRHGSSLGIAGKEGFLYSDRDDNTVRRQVVAMGGACGLNINDELVEGLSPRAIRGVVIADRSKEAGDIIVTTEGPGCPSHEPVVLVDDRVIDLQQYVEGVSDHNGEPCK
jgi:hypothetical protein